MNLSNFLTAGFLPALKAFFKDLQVPVNYLTDEPEAPTGLLSDFTATMRPFG